MDNNDVLRRLRYTFDLGDSDVIKLFLSGGIALNREIISNLMKKDDDPTFVPCSNKQLNAFLNGLILEKRGAKPNSEASATPEGTLTNNTVLRKLKIALELKEADMLEIMQLSGLPLGRSELSALFRHPEHHHYRPCQDQLLRHFLKGLQDKVRPPILTLETQPMSGDEPVDGAGVDQAEPTEGGFESLPGFTWTAAIRTGFARDNITSPSEAQRLSFEPILAGNHVLIDSGTGTGKTLAYVLPLLLQLERNPAARIVCLAPAAELAIQTYNVIMRYKPESLAVGTLVGGGNQHKQKDRIQKSTRLIVGTTGRVLETIAERKLKGITTFVLDEPEPILSSKDAQFLLEVISRPPRPQLIVAGATFGDNSSRLLTHLRAEGLVQARSTVSPLVDNIIHHRLKVRDAGDRDLQLARFLERESDDRAIVYVNQAHLIRHLYRYLVDNGFVTVSLSQDRTKQQCKEAISTFANGEAQVLLTTDRAATGIDLKGVPWVVHYELPHSPQAYVHRAGRTGRAGQSGRTLALIDDSQRFIIKKLEDELGITFHEFRLS